jgi:hypothetical protein
MNKSPRIVDQEPAALLGLDWQWENGDKFALVEAIALCTTNEWEYPDWVQKIIGQAMVNMYQAVYPEVDLDLSKPSKIQLPKAGIDKGKLARRLKKELAQSLDLLGLKIDKSNAVKRRKETLRDLHLANIIAGRCKFIREPAPRFKGVDKAIDGLAVALADGADPSPLEKYPDECFDASDHIIKRAWKRHKDKMIQQYLIYPEVHPEQDDFASLDIDLKNEDTQ